jgi:DNA-directed RNA polymerase specialized sigma24 family protein
MADSNRRPPAQGDEADLFRSFNDQLMRTVARRVDYTSPEVIEDACSFAWAAFLEHQPSRERSWQAWMVRTAERKAWELERQARDNGSDLPLDEGRVEEDERSPIEQVEIRHDVREALTVLSKLSPRLQRIALMRALGLKHREIGVLTGDSTGRVRALLGQANERIYDVLAVRAHESDQGSPRADRLWQLEHDPPKWLIEKIGRPVKLNRRVAGRTARRRAWLRAALALDDYRNVAGSSEFEAMTDKAPADPALRAPHAHAVCAVENFEAEYRRERGCSRGR